MSSAGQAAGAKKRVARATEGEGREVY